MQGNSLPAHTQFKWWWYAENPVLNACLKIYDVQILIIRFYLHVRHSIYNWKWNCLNILTVESLVPMGKLNFIQEILMAVGTNTQIRRKVEKKTWLWNIQYTLIDKLHYKKTSNFKKIFNRLKQFSVVDITKRHWI